VALRAKAPIYVNEKLLQTPPQQEEEEAGEEPHELTDEEKAEQLRRFLEKLNPRTSGNSSSDGSRDVMRLAIASIVMLAAAPIAIAAHRFPRRRISRAPSP